MINDREEALATHELARTRIANRKQSNFTPFKKIQKVWLDMRNLKMNYHKKIALKQEGPFSWTSDLLIKAPDNLEDLQHVSCNLTATLHQK